MGDAERRGLRELQEQHPNHIVSLGRYGEAVLTPKKDVPGLDPTIPEVDNALNEWKVKINTGFGQSTLLGLELEGVL